MKEAESRVGTMRGLAVFAAIAYHGALLANGSFRRTYDAFVHIFFADHYARGWFELWEPRWYTGFTVTSYPPGSHQLVALLSRLLGLEAAFAVVQLVAVVLLVTGVYRFSRIWFGDHAAGWAAMAAVFATGIGEAVHVFGQLPTTLALGLLLHALPYVHSYVIDGGRSPLVRGLVLLAATTSAHHVTTIFGMVFFAGPVVATAVLHRLATARDDEPLGHPERVNVSNILPLVVRRIRRIWRPMSRAAWLGVAAGILLGLVILPYWLWSRADPITQIPIPHASRDDFLVNLNAGLIFWVVPWGAGLVLLPAALWRGLRSAAWPLAASAAFAALLGTGGTTPVPRLLLGGAYDILTLDRFTFWATVLVLPLFGVLLSSLWSGAGAAWIRAKWGRRVLVGTHVLLAAVFLGASVWTNNLAALRPMQPDPIDPAPITSFLQKDQHSRWRYLTLGFGDQMAWVAAQTTAQTVDGNYHSARRLPELVSTPVERLEGAKFRGIPGIGSLQQFLAVPEKYHLKFVFSNDAFYDPLLFYSGWHVIERLENGIVVWEREDVPPLPPELPRTEYPLYQRAMWGLLPPAALAAAAALPFVRVRRRRRRSDRGRTVRFAAQVDRVLLRWSPVPDGTRSQSDWRRWRDVTVRVMSCLKPRGRMVWVGISVAAVGFGALAAGGVEASTSPADTVVAYYEALDYHDFDGAWEFIDPDERPSLDAYLLDRSVRDGLVTSYSMLDSVVPAHVTEGEKLATVDVELVYATSLIEYRIERRHHLVRRDGRWYIEPDVSDPAFPDERFIRRTTVQYASLGRRLPTTGTTVYADVLDRPELAVASARLVMWQGRPVLVGELFNQDVDPADVTVTGQLVDATGEVMARFNSAQIMNHKLRPGERTPFRIDFEEVAGAGDRSDPAAGSFRPGAFTPIRMDTAIGGVDIYAKALVTARDLDRQLIVDGLSVTSQPGGAVRVTGRLINDGTITATVPRVLVTAYDDSGAVAWVENHYLSESIAIGHDGHFTVDVPPAEELVATDAEPRLFVNSLPEPSEAPVGNGHIQTPPGSGYASVTVSAVAFSREGS